MDWVDFYICTPSPAPKKKKIKKEKSLLLKPAWVLHNLFIEEILVGSLSPINEVNQHW